MDHYDIRLRPQGSTSWSILINNIQGTSKTKIGLSSSTTYEWQIRSACSIDSSSASSWSSMQSFTTLAGCITPVNATELGVGLTVATLTWDAMVDSWGYVVRYKEVSQQWGAMVYDTVHTNSYALNSLIPGTYYQWQVRNLCDSTGSNSSSFTSNKIFITVNGCDKPINMHSTSITSSSGTLNWDLVSGALSYRVRYVRNGAAWNTRVDTTIITNTHNISGLFSNSDYRWRIRAICDSSGSYNSGWTPWDTLSTLPSSRIAIGDSKLANKLNIFPNPTREIFNISFISEEMDNFKISIVDVYGKAVTSEYKHDFIGEYKKQLNLSGYPKGIYMVQIKTSNSFVSKRVVLQ
jgi:hypothetical protein